MKILQLLPSLHYGDAVGNDAVALHHFLTEEGCDTHIYAEQIDQRIPDGIASSYTKLPVLSAEDIVMYHFAIGSPVMEKILCSLPAHKFMIYHNITPAKYFTPYNKIAEEAADEGRKSLRSMAEFFEYCIADSAYNKEDLRFEGYTCPIDVVPIMIPFADYDKDANHLLLEKYQHDEMVNFLFVGRIVPNKKQEDVIKTFAYYHKNISANSRLFLVGNYQGMELYYQRLVRYAKVLDIADAVFFTGHTSFADILAYYRMADVFLCMSEHEGFCVPLLEAMYFEVPIVACDAAAVSETLGDGGILVNTRRPDVIAKVIDRVLKDKHLCNTLVRNGKERLKNYSYEIVSQAMGTYIFAAFEKEPGNFILEKEKKLVQKQLGYQDKEVNRILSTGDTSLGKNLDDFCNTPIPSIPLKVCFKKKLHGILRIMYHSCARVSPTLAAWIREKLFSGWNRL